MAKDKETEGIIPYRCLASEIASSLLFLLSPNTLSDPLDLYL